MRRKEDSVVITFSSTTAAIAADRYFTEAGLPGRLIPVPREITAGCGLAWRILPEEEAKLRQALTEAKLDYEQIVRLLL